MILPKKCGEMYIKFDKNDQPEYGFKVYKNRIVKFVPLASDDLSAYSRIILPKFEDEVKPDMPKTQDPEEIDAVSFIKKMDFKDYICGNVKISSCCFEGIKKAKIIVPFKNSIMLDWDSFEEDAEIELVLPSSLSLKQVYRRFDTGFDYEHENWTLVADKSIEGDFSCGGFLIDDYSIDDYNEKNLEHRVANFKVSHLGLDKSHKSVSSEDIAEV